MENKFLNVNFNGPFVHADIFFSSFRPSPSFYFVFDANVREEKYVKKFMAKCES